MKPQTFLWAVPAAMLGLFVASVSELRETLGSQKSQDNAVKEMTMAAADNVGQSCREPFARAADGMVDYVVAPGIRELPPPGIEFAHEQGVRIYPGPDQEQNEFWLARGLKYADCRDPQGFSEDACRHLIDVGLEYDREMASQLMLEREDEERQDKRCEAYREQPIGGLGTILNRALSVTPTPCDSVDLGATYNHRALYGFSGIEEALRSLRFTDQNVHMLSERGKDYTGEARVYHDKARVRYNEAVARYREFVAAAPMLGSQSPVRISAAIEFGEKPGVKGVLRQDESLDHPALIVTADTFPVRGLVVDQLLAEFQEQGGDLNGGALVLRKTGEWDNSLSLDYVPAESMTTANLPGLPTLASCTAEQPEYVEYDPETTDEVRYTMRYTPPSFWQPK